MKSSAESSVSLPEVNASVDTTAPKSGWKKILAFLGPAYLISVGYMDPGNWATDIAGGSQFGYKLIWVLVVSNLMALLLQGFCARLGIVRGMDLAQASRASYPRWVNLILYFLAEIAIAATDLAEVVGMAIGLKLLFGLPLLAGITISVLDTFLILFLMNFGIRKLEAFILGLVAIIGGCFLLEMFLAKPQIAEIATGLIPSIPNNQALYIAIGIIGATVMPHNLYLHSSLVQTRKIQRTPEAIGKAIRYNMLDSAIALNLALFVNAAILILAATAFYKNELYEVADIQDAHHLLAPLLGSGLAPVFFAVALIAAGQSSTITGTLAGQIVMEGYLNLRIQPWLRRFMTRAIAIIPAYLTIYWAGEEKTGDLLVFSQVVLSMQLGFATIPLIHFVSDKSKMGAFAIKLPTKILAWTGASVIVALNVKLVFEEIKSLMEASGEKAWLVMVSVIPIAFFMLGLLLFIALKPLFKGFLEKSRVSPHSDKLPLVFTPKSQFQRIAIAVDFSNMDTTAINHAIAQGGQEASYCLIHIVETAGARIFGPETGDQETFLDRQFLSDYVKALLERGFRAEGSIGFGIPKIEIAKLTQAFDADLLVMGAHGHKGLKDWILGTTINGVRHRLPIPVLVVR